MPAPGAPEGSAAEALLAAPVQHSSGLKAPALPDSPRNGRAKGPSGTKSSNPRDFVRIQPLPSLPEREGKILARSRTVYRSSGPPREEVYWENHCRRQRQLVQGQLTPRGMPYQELGEVLCMEPRKLTLIALGQLAQEPVKKDKRERPPPEVAEVTTDKRPLKPKPDPPESVKRLTSPRGTGKELKTLSKALAQLRRHISIVKQGREYFHLLHQESLKRKKALKARQTEATTWITDFQPDKYSSDVEVSGGEINTSLTEGSQLKKKKMTLRSFTPVYTNVLTPRFAEEKSEQVFRQLCAIHWLLEASTLESNNLIHSILSCWNQTDPGGFKKSVKEMEGEKLTACMWELFLTNTKKYLRKARRSPLTRRANKAFAPFISQLSSQSSHGQTPFSSVNSLVVCSEDNAKVTGALSDSMSISQQPKEQQPFFSSPQKLIQVTDEVSKDVREQEGTLKKTELKSGHISNFIKKKSNLRADARQKFTAIRDEAACCLHDTLESLERSQEERCSQKYQALKRLKYFKEDMERLRQLDVRPEREQENELTWFPVLLARLPESVKSDHYVKKILKKLEKFGLNPDLQIHPDTFLKVLTDLQVWELCSPEIAAAVEFVRENIVQMPEEDFSEWFQTRVGLLHAQSSTF